MKSFKEILKGKTKIEISEYFEKKLIANGYIYNPVFGWERIEIINQFSLNPNIEGVPCSLQAKWVVAKSKKIKDGFGNVMNNEHNTWVRSDILREYYPIDNWLAYKEFKRKQDKSHLATEQNINNIIAYDNCG